MSERPPAPGAVEQHLARWFEAEVRRAERDLAAGPVTLPPTTRRLPWLPAAGVIVAVLVVVVVLPRSTPTPVAGPPDTTPSPSADRTAAPSPTAEPSTPPPTPTLAVAERYPDGIPKVLHGMPVVRVGTTDTGSLLVGGWAFRTTVTTRGCPPGASCPGIPQVRLGDVPGIDVGSTVVALVGLDGEIPPGPVVVRAHVVGRSCAPEATCYAAEEVLWTGDESTDGEPLRIDEVVAALRRDVVPDLTVDPAPPRNEPCDPGFPGQRWHTDTLEDGSRIWVILVYPDIRSRIAVDSNFHPSGWAGRGCSVIFDMSLRWEFVENVIIGFGGAAIDPGSDAFAARITDALAEATQR